MKRVVEEHLGADTAKLFANAEQNVNHELDRLRQELEVDRSDARERARDGPQED
jgi:streptomycin 6-kinase